MIRFKDKNYKLPITEKDLLYIINKDLFYELVLYMYSKGYVDMWLLRLRKDTQGRVFILPVSKEIESINCLSKYKLNESQKGFKIISKKKLKSITKDFIIKTKPFNLEYICNTFGNELEKL